MEGSIQDIMAHKAEFAQEMEKEIKVSYVWHDFQDIPIAILKASVASETPIFVVTSRTHFPDLDNNSKAFGPFPFWASSLAFAYAPANFFFYFGSHALIKASRPEIKSLISIAEQPVKDTGQTSRRRLRRPFD